MKLIINILFLLTQTSVIYSALVLPIKKCELSDSACLTASAQAVVREFATRIDELGVEKLDPMPIDLIKVDLSGLKLLLRDLELKGLRNSVIDKISVNTAKKEMQVVFHVDANVKGKYKASGQLLILPISGDGDAFIKIKNAEIQINIVYDIVKNKDGKDVIEFKSHTFKHDVKDNAHFQLTNLFNGNKALSDAMLTFMNDNWKILTMEFGTAMFEKPVKLIYNAIKAYLQSQPLEEIANA